jgi:two-component system osmolarity sensor histidine kinase EnvZ
VDLADVVDACRANVDVSEQTRLRLEIGDQQMVVRGDEALLRLAITNLIDNSLKYSAGSVVIRVGQASEGIRLSIDDHGPGIPPEDLERVREPFVRGRGLTNGIRGAGLGLALVRHVAILHGGALDIDNRIGGGLRAMIRLAPWRPAAA